MLTRFYLINIEFNFVKQIEVEPDKKDTRRKTPTTDEAESIIRVESIRKRVRQLEKFISVTLHSSGNILKYK